MKGNILKIPISREQRLINQYGKGYVPCEVSGRWLQFSEESNFVGEKELFFVDVMTYDSNDNPKKICNLCISREDIARALSNIKPIKK